MSSADKGGSGAGWLPLCCGWVVDSVRGEVSVMLLGRQSVDEGDECASAGCNC